MNTAPQPSPTPDPNSNSITGFPFFTDNLKADALAASPLLPLPAAESWLPPVHPSARTFDFEKIKRRVGELLARDERQSALELNVAVQRALRYPMQSLVAAGVVQVQVDNLNCQCAACQAYRAARRASP